MHRNVAWQHGGRDRPAGAFRDRLGVFGGGPRDDQQGDHGGARGARLELHPGVPAAGDEGIPGAGAGRGCRTGAGIVVFRIILHDDFRIISDANLVIIQIVSCRRELGARGLTEAAGSGKFPSGGTDDSDLFCFAADLQLNRGLDGSAVGWQGVVRSGQCFAGAGLGGWLALLGAVSGLQ